MDTMIAVTVRHNFETAHRLYAQGPGTKCWSLHGHSFWTEITVAAPAVDERGMVVEYGELKRAVRAYIDGVLDHGAVLNVNDPLCAALDTEGCKFLTLSCDPTVEALAVHLHDVVSKTLAKLEHAEGAHVRSVKVQETHVNGAEYTCAT